MEIYHILIIAAILAFTIEMFTASFFAASVGIGFLLAAIGNYFDATTEWQIYIFTFGVIISFFGIRPLFNKIAYNSDSKQTNQHAMIGRTAIVVEEINEKNRTGLVKLDGDIWKAKTAKENSIIEMNSNVEVLNINSVVLTVKMIN
jgi:membrane protein implicated in regulation of membrane protease activity